MVVSQDDRFEDRFGRIKAVYESIGARPFAQRDFKLLEKRDRAFIRRIRCEIGKGIKYPQHRLVRLASVGVVLETHHDRFKRMVSEVKERTELETAGSNPGPMSKELSQFMRNARYRKKKGTLPAERFKALKEAGMDFNPMAKKCSRNNYRVHWQGVIDSLKGKASRSDLVWMENAILRYYDKNFLDVAEYSSIAELVLKALKVGDIPPNECMRDASKTNIRYTLSFFGKPESFRKNRMKPTHKSPTGKSVYFGPQEVKKDEVLLECMKLVEEQAIPGWIVELNSGTVLLSKDELVSRIAAEGTFFDGFEVSRKGTNYSDGLVKITETSQPGPRRLNLSDEFGAEWCSQFFNCHLCEGYSYTLSFCTSFHCCGRPLTLHPSIAELKVAAWKSLWPWLSPVSKVCPPTGCQALTHFKKFKSKIKPHKDMNPDMAVDTSTNSQITGSSVIVVSLLASQHFEICNKVKTNAGKDKHVPVCTFPTEDCSVYILDPEDDLQWCHQARFPAGCPSNAVRVCLTFRWLAKRMEFLGGDCGGHTGNRAHAQAVRAPRTIINNFKSSAKRDAYFKSMKMKEKSPQAVDV